MGLHGEACHAVARTFEQSGHVLIGAGDVCPDGLFLERIEEQAAVAGFGEILPCGAKEGLPVEDGWGGPGCQALGAASAMKGGCEGAGGALAGGNHQAATAQP